MIYTVDFYVSYRSLFLGLIVILCILIRAWVCPPRPSIEILPHSVFEAMYMSGPHILDPIVIILYPDTSMGIPASSISSDDSSSFIEVMYF